MKINKGIMICGLTAMLLTPLACSEDFLNQKSLSGSSEDVLFKKPEDGVRLINAIYDTFHNVDFLLKALWYQANFLTQDFKNYGADTFFETYEVKPDFEALQVFWERAYIGIGRANAALDIVERMKTSGVLSEQLANRLRGEALFLRGVFYYYLASNFGGVPLELKTVTDDGRHPRNTQDEVFQAVANDMATAFDLLQWRADMADEDLGRATKASAAAYWGDALMWLKKYDEAVDAYNLLENHVALEEKFLDIHEYDNQNNKESIFEIQYIEGANMEWSAANDVQWISTFGMPWEVTNFGYAYADKKLYESFEAGDERKVATVIGPGDTHPSPHIQISSYPKVQQMYGGINTLGTVGNPWKGDDNLRSGYYGVKNWRDPKARGATGTPGYIMSGQNLILMRYGQVLISKAEAQLKSGDESDAMATIQKVRDRAFGKLRNNSVFVPVPVETDKMKIILDEYRHELAGEFSQWFMLRRSGLHREYVLAKYGITVPNGKDLMPIPQKMIAVNEKLVQNDGY